MNSYHVFCLYIGDRWHRTTQVLDYGAFKTLMDLLDWRMPYNMRAFHYHSTKQPPTSINPVFLEMPEQSIDLHAFFTERKGVRLKKRDQAPVPIPRLGGGFAVITNDDGYGRLVTCTDPDDDLLFDEYYPLSFREAKAFIDRHHRHNEAPKGHKFSIGLLRQGLLAGVIVASIPRARALNDGFTLELIRCCVLPDNRNACSKLYGKAILAGRCMGYRRFATYTLPHESGSSLKAVGFKPDGMTEASPGGWSRPSRLRNTPARYPSGPKYRWVINIEGGSSK